MAPRLLSRRFICEKIKTHTHTQRKKQRHA